MMRALYSSVAGLKTHQTKMDVIGNNIANVNTVGFKSSRATFSTMMYQTLSFASGANAETGKGGVNAKQIGLGATFASTAVDIDTGGASESTGKAFDLKLSDKNSTSFYIVNTGTENVFTRAGAFYVDGAGNLCMESTGYTVMGWQADANGNIRKDTVTPLKIMQPSNQTSAPEYTTKGRCTGILDDNNANANSDTGYLMNMNIFDNLGYPYTARFAIQKTGEAKSGEYTVNLTDILDSKGKSILNKNIALSDLFGSGTGQGSKVDITDSYKLQNGMLGALKRVALTLDTTGKTDGSGKRIYRFSSETVNQYLSTSANQLPSGLTVEFEVPYTKDGDRDISANAAYKVTIRDGSGADVTDKYKKVDAKDVDPTAATKNLSLLVDSDGKNITRTVSAKDKIQEWYDRNALDSKGAGVYLLTSQQLQSLKDEFEALKDIQLTAQVKVTIDKSGKVTGVANYPDDTTASEVTKAAVNAIGGAARNYNLVDYMQQGYLTVNATSANEGNFFTTELPNDVEIRYKDADGSYTIVTPAKDGFKMQFSTADGSLTYIGTEGNTSQVLRLSNYPMEDNPFSDIEIDFSTLKNLANGASNTAAMSAGDGSGGEGKRIGTLIGLSVEQSGKIYGNYSNGNTELLGQIAVARFGNASGLESIGNNCYRTTMNSGEFDGIGVEMDSDGSSIDSGVLEMSNVDLASEFTYMITTQRGYQANSRVISTSDGILEELVNLKR